MTARYTSAIKGDSRILTVVCPMCAQPNQVAVQEEDFQYWSKSHDHVSKCFPYLTRDEAEILISGVDGRCWDEMFKESDD